MTWKGKVKALVDRGVRMQRGASPYLEDGARVEICTANCKLGYPHLCANPILSDFAYVSGPCVQLLWI
jgi:hypothetical protein